MLKTILTLGTLTLSGALVLNTSNLLYSEASSSDSTHEVTVYIAKPQMLKDVIRATAKIEPQFRQDEYLSNGSELDKILVNSGNEVTKGDTLSILRNSDISKEKRASQMELIRLEHKLTKLEMGDNSDDIVKAKRELAFTRIDYEKQLHEVEILDELYKSKAISLKEFQDASNQLKKLELRLDAEKSNLNTTISNQDVELQLTEIEYAKAKQVHDEILQSDRELTIKAKFDGKVITINDDVTSKDDKPKPFISIATPTLLQANIDIDTFDAPKVSIGTNVEIYINELNMSLKGEISELGQEVVSKQSTVSGQSRNVIEAVALLNGESLQKVTLGIDTEAQIITSEKDHAITLPLDAILEENGSYYVYIEKDGIAEKRFLHTGTTTSGSIEVLAGIIKDERIITRGNLAIEHGSHVIVSATEDNIIYQSGQHTNQTISTGFTSFQGGAGLMPQGAPLSTQPNSMNTQE